MRLLVLLFFLIALSSCNVMNGKTNIDDDFFVGNNDNGIYLSYSSHAFNEAAADDGSIDTIINVYLYGTTFSGTDGSNLSAGKFIVSNVPPGLTAELYQLNNQQLEFRLTGFAGAHTSVTDDISNLTVNLLDSAFTNTSAGNVGDSTSGNMSVTFI